jgi:hypothetical protein
VIVVYRGHATMQETLDEALTAAIDPQPVFPIRRGPELGGEPGFVRNGSGGLQRGQLKGFSRGVPLQGDKP